MIYCLLCVSVTAFSVLLTYPAARLSTAVADGLARGQELAPDTLPLG